MTVDSIVALHKSNFFLNLGIRFCNPLIQKIIWLFYSLFNLSLPCFPFSLIELLQKKKLPLHWINFSLSSLFSLLLYLTITNTIHWRRGTIYFSSLSTFFFHWPTQQLHSHHSTSTIYKQTTSSFPFHVPFNLFCLVSNKLTFLFIFTFLILILITTHQSKIMNNKTQNLRRGTNKRRHTNKLFGGKQITHHQLIFRFFPNYKTKPISTLCRFFLSFL